MKQLMDDTSAGGRILAASRAGGMSRAKVIAREWTLEVFDAHGRPAMCELWWDIDEPHVTNGGLRWRTGLEERSCPAPISSDVGRVIVERAGRDDLRDAHRRALEHHPDGTAALGRANTGTSVPRLDDTPPRFSAKQRFEFYALGGLIVAFVVVLVVGLLHDHPTSHGADIERGGSSTLAVSCDDLPSFVVHIDDMDPASELAQNYRAHGNRVVSDHGSGSCVYRK